MHSELWSYVSGQIPKPASGDATLAECLVKDEKALATIMLSVKTSQLLHAKKLTTSAAAWVIYKEVQRPTGRLCAPAQPQNGTAAVAVVTAAAAAVRAVVVVQLELPTLAMMVAGSAAREERGTASIATAAAAVERTAEPSAAAAADDASPLLVVDEALTLRKALQKRLQDGRAAKALGRQEALRRRRQTIDCRWAQPQQQVDYNAVQFPKKLRAFRDRH